MRLTRETKQKEQLNEEMSRMNSFFTAEELFDKVKSKKIGIATVYRFLNASLKKGKLHSYVCNRRMLYSTGEKSHCHFVCEKCGLRKHIKITKLDFLKKEIKEDVCHFQIDVFGMCRECKNKK